MNFVVRLFVSNNFVSDGIEWFQTGFFAKGFRCKVSRSETLSVTKAQTETIHYDAL